MRIAAIYSLGAAAVLAALHGWMGHAYTNYAEGVYLFSARLILEGAVPYRDFLAAHPPLLFHGGAGALSISGTYVNTIALAEPLLVALGAAGVAWLLAARAALPRCRAWLAVAGAAVVISVAQVASFIADPHEPGFFVRPFSAPAHGWPASEAAVDRSVAVTVSRCGPDEGYAGAPFYALVARRPMPADEPDQFLLARPFAAERAAEVRAVLPGCR